MDFEGEDLRHADITWLVPDAGTPGLVYLGTRYNGLYQTTDAGKSWTLISGDLGKPVVMSLAQDPTNPKVSTPGHWMAYIAATTAA